MFVAPKLTNAGKALYNENIGGTPIKFTTIKLGSGYISGPIAPMTALINTVVTITAAVAVYDDYVNISGAFSNADLSDGFYWREIGVFAADPACPDDRAKDILYCYQNAYDTADYIPVATVETVEKSIAVPVIVGDTETVSCILSSSLIYVSQQDLDNHNHSATAHEDIRSLITNKPLQVFYGTCSTASATAAKTAAITGFIAQNLTAGVIVGVAFTNANTSTAATLNITGTGAKSIKALGAAPVSGQIGAGMLAFFQYDGTNWVHINPIPVDKLGLGGGTMTGAITLPGDPTANLHAATKQYVDNQLADFVELTRFTSSGAFNPADFPSIGGRYVILLVGAGAGGNAGDAGMTGTDNGYWGMGGNGGKGGESGGCAILELLNPVSGSYTVTIGSGGNGGTAAAKNGVAGGATSFQYTSSYISRSVSVNGGRAGDQTTIPDVTITEVGFKSTDGVSGAKGAGGGVGAHFPPAYPGYPGGGDAGGAAGAAGSNGDGGNGGGTGAYNYANSIGGAGGNGGTGSSGGSGSAGNNGSAAVNPGAGGGGGGGGGGGTSSGGPGGAGGNGGKGGNGLVVVYGYRKGVE